MIKIISRYSHAAGSTLALVNLCNEFNSKGFACIFYGPDNWHVDKCKSGNLADFFPEAGDNIIVNDIPLSSIGDLSNLNALVEENGSTRLLRTLKKIVLRFLLPEQPRNYQLFLTCLNDESLSCSSARLALFQASHFASIHLRDYARTPCPKFISPSFCSNLHKTEQKPTNVAGIIGSIKKQNNIVEAVEQAVLDGMESVIIFGYMKDPAYYYNKIVPLTIKHRGKIKYAGFMDDRQKMYDAVSDVYIATNKPWSKVSYECIMTNTKLHAPEPMGAEGRMSNDQIFEIWKNGLSLSSGVA